MESVLVRSLGYVLVIILGYSLKKKGLLEKEDGHKLSVIIMNLTLPAVLLTNSADMILDVSMLLAVVLGIVTNFILLWLGYMITRKRERATTATFMICCSGHNIGNFVLPICQMFFSGTALAYLCMFDMGNSFFVLGGSYSVGLTIVNQDEKISIASIGRRLLQSPAFVTYIVIILLKLLNISLSDNVFLVTGYIGGANGFLVMLMIGILIEFKMKKSQMRDVAKILAVRYGVGILASIVVYTSLPLPIEAKYILILALMAPISTISSVYAKQCGYQKDVPAMANSISIIIGIVLSVVLLLLVA